MFLTLITTVYRYLLLHPFHIPCQILPLTSSVYFPSPPSLSLSTSSISLSSHALHICICSLSLFFSPLQLTLTQHIYHSLVALLQYLLALQFFSCFSIKLPICINITFLKIKIDTQDLINTTTIVY